MSERKLHMLDLNQMRQEIHENYLELNSLLEREPLVQAVITASKHLSSLTKYNSGYLAFQDAEMALAKACRALAEWKGGAT